MEFLNSFGKPVFIVPGNWDQSLGKTAIKEMNKSGYNFGKSALDYMWGEEINKSLKKGLKNVYDCQFKLHKFNGINLVGYGNSNFPEKDMLKRGKNKIENMRLKRAYSRIFERIRKRYGRREKQNSTIFLSHNVPFGTKLDVILNKDSPLHKKHYGSNIAREFCKRYQPLICIGGHIHEHFGKDKIGKTTVVNVGHGAYVNILLEIKNNKIKKLEFWDGKELYK